MTNGYKYYLELNNEKLSEFNKFEEAKVCFDYIVKTFPNQKVENLEKDIEWVRLDITPVFVEENRGPRLISGETDTQVFNKDLKQAIIKEINNYVQ
ncbi:hypothetical protein [Lysinibacillus sphaericus]|uniref:hypothetical protein n=1 Tax=Lysinibacillus sphaericus TaxID=1421 RepID=UPI002DBA11A6|nr:hypothetical protein [Lysinibacillus sphaericus]MEB7455118.1 hypothetical protein [Lysinibacillus sphaericus]